MTKHYAGARIHTLRANEGLTQVDMARKLGISTSYLNHCLLYTSPSPRDS